MIFNWGFQGCGKPFCPLKRHWLRVKAESRYRLVSSFKGLTAVSSFRHLGRGTKIRLNLDSAWQFVPSPCGRMT